MARRVQLAPFLALALAGCEARLTLGSPCTRTADCPAPYACILGACRTECVADADCAIGVHCVAVAPGTGACTFETEERCSTTICPAPLECLDGRCQTVCTTDRDCLATETCTGARCRPSGSIFPRAILCTTAADCEAGEICASDFAPDVCHRGCDENADCPAGSACDHYAADVDGGFVFGCSAVCRPGTGEGCAPGLSCRMVVRSQFFVPGDPANITVCASSVPGRTQGCPCEVLDSANDCAEGFSCEMAPGGRMCLEICTVGELCPSGEPCVATDRSVVLDGLQYGVCPGPAAPRTDCP